MSMRINHIKGAKLETEKFTLRQGVDLYLKHLTEKGASTNTVSVYRRCLALAVDHFGEDRDLQKMIPAHVSRYFGCDVVNKKPDGSPRADISIRQIKRVFRQMLNYLCNEVGKLESVPLSKKDQPSI